MSPGRSTSSGPLIRLADDETLRVRRTDVGYSKGGTRAVLISESGLYNLVLRSDKPEAKVFQDWVTREVLPAFLTSGHAFMATLSIGPTQ